MRREGGRWEDVSGDRAKFVDDGDAAGEERTGANV
jgi:hypothetical protein